MQGKTSEFSFQLREVAAPTEADRCGCVCVRKVWWLLISVRTVKMWLAWGNKVLHDLHPQTLSLRVTLELTRGPAHAHSYLNYTAWSGCVLIRPCATANYSNKQLCEIHLFAFAIKILGTTFVTLILSEKFAYGARNSGQWGERKHVLFISCLLALGL